MVWVWFGLGLRVLFVAQGFDLFGRNHGWHPLEQVMRGLGMVLFGFGFGLDWGSGFC